MSDQPNEGTPTQTTEAATASWDDLFGNEDPQKVRKSLDHAREWEKRAKENAAAAKRLAELEEAQKSETEKAADRIAKAEAEAGTVPARVAEALKAHLVALHEIDKDRAELFLTATDPELLLRQVNGLLEESGKRKKNGNHVPREGNTSQPTDDPVREFARDLFGKARSE